MYGMIKTLKTVIICLLFTLMLTGCSHFADYEKMYNGHVAGTVYDRATGEPLQGVTVFYDYYTEGEGQEWNGIYYYYGEMVFEGITTTDEEGKFLVRSLEEQKEYVLVLRKWPGYEQKELSSDTELPITTTPFQTNYYDIYLDSSLAEFSIEPASLHFQAGEERHYLVIINEGKTPINWLLTENAAWISSLNIAGILGPKDVEATFIEVDRELINEASVQDTIYITVLSTRETRAVPVSVEK